MIWLIGHRGMLGREMERLLSCHKLPHLATDIEVDVGDYRVLTNHARDVPIDWIINCAAFTAVDRAEDQRETAFRINASGARNVALLAEERQAKLVHISTDYIFDGRKEGGYTEEDPPGPLGVYGESKLLGERYIRETTGRSFILRSSWLFGSGGRNFVSTMIDLFRTKEEVRVVADQWGSPTYAGDLARVILKIIADKEDRFGIYHFSNEGKTNWYEFALAIYGQAREIGLVKREANILPVTTGGYPTRALRPANSYLLKDKIISTLGLTPRPWPEALAEYLDKLKEEGSLP